MAKKSKFVSGHRFSAQWDYLCLRYGDKTIFFNADANDAVVVAGHFFQAVACDSVVRIYFRHILHRSEGYNVQACLCLIVKYVT